MGHVTACDIDKLAFGMDKSRVDAPHRAHAGIKIGQKSQLGLLFYKCVVQLRTMGHKHDV